MSLAAPFKVVVSGDETEKVLLGYLIKDSVQTQHVHRRLQTVTQIIVPKTFLDEVLSLVQNDLSSLRFNKIYKVSEKVVCLPV